MKSSNSGWTLGRSGEVLVNMGKDFGTGLVKVVLLLLFVLSSTLDVGEKRVLGMVVERVMVGEVLSVAELETAVMLVSGFTRLDKMGALRKTLLLEHQTWHLFSCPWLHAGLFHLIINLTGVIFLGIYLEQEFGPLRVGVVYFLSAFFGTLVTALFVRDSPIVSSSSAQLGLLGATLSALVRNWKIYTNKLAAVLILFAVFACNFMLGLLPYIDNYSNIGGLISGFLLGIALLFTPQLRQVAQNKSGLYDSGVKSSFNLKQKLDRPVLRSVSLLLFAFLLVGFLVAALQGINISQYCQWCGYFDCIPSKRWNCNDVTTYCEIMLSDTELTLTCLGNGNFRVFPYTNISDARKKDVCTLICS
ncbi:hypothetical protein GH714_001931 [Hevea brasiliensis]|uniref:RHOMBOID-like protein n=1 Tax=Hevea brasiliensis TaxID=3981 RepID=A0A6A6L713_HEVBR|nr:hypothetical protein GH714_001931 [Hevea brasiliensis]